MANTIEWSTDGVVSAGSSDIFTFSIPAAGRHVVLMDFGGAIPFSANGSYIAMQYGQAGSWKTIRVITRESEYKINQEIIADGTKTIRIIRNNGDTVNRPMFAWVTGFIR